MTNEQKQRITEFREQGYGYSSIADALGLTKNQVSAFCRRNQLAGEKGTRESISATNLCRNCGKPLLQPTGKKSVKFCCSECRVSWWNSHPDKVNRKALYDYTCSNCGKVFIAYGNSRRKYCSHSCYIAARFGGGRNDG